MFIGDCLDGGASPWLHGLNQDGSRPRMWLGQKKKSEEVLWDENSSNYWPPVQSLPNAATRLDVDEIPVRCHCKGVDLVLRVGLARREFEEKASRGEALPWMVDPVTHKLIADFDACDSCRISSGVEIFHWMLALLRYVGFPAGSDGLLEGFPATTGELRDAVAGGEEAGKRDPRLGTLAYYASSIDVQRYFCSRCSACVFYVVDDRPELVDVAVGLLDSPDGARAEGVLAWNFGGRVNWRQDMFGGWREHLVKSVEIEAEKWRVERGYPKIWKQVEREEA
ncbi:uncharacterized protein BCR38DRAFT_431107 [Pseudomassariella vexata]|uniref:Uncharacterized protein n=1 Tax=Pseudomassariella vexata TaxID=1141098 RepID=A0A1Y2DZY2_9PEZI|nr:uncharacterized protein BCR38DRAFT_431107 [Pseudomassariella vexata]ORY64843.1 hypothetical protein BCR38DRAFT_431107 [Pseudomassariella vexata]